MRIGVAGLAFACVALGAPAFAAQRVCSEIVHLTVEPSAKAEQVAAVLRRRLEGVEASVEREGEGLRATLPAGAGDTLLTRPARIEFRLVAAKADAPGATLASRWQGAESESIEPQIIIDETHLRDFKATADPHIADAARNGAVEFHLDPHAMKNLMAASTEAIGRKLAILVDGRIVVDPTIRAPIATAGGEISGGFSAASAVELVKLLAIGRLPARVTIAAREPATCAAN